MSRLTIATASAVAALALGACSGSGSDASDCVRLVIERAAKIEREYRDGTLTGPAKRFLDEHGENLSMVPAEVEIADERRSSAGS
jgi:hypothetical protein